MAPPAPAPASAGMSDDDTARLKQLGELHANGVLSNEEFTQAKTKILDG
jgi:Short C-terminal domain